MSCSTVKKVSALILSQSDIRAAVEFYELIGLRKKFEVEERWVELMLGDIKIGLCVTSDEPAERFTGIIFEVDDLMAFYGSMKNLITFVRTPVEAVHGIMATIKDPGGNLIDVYQPTPEKMKEAFESLDSGGKHESSIKEEK